MSTPMFARTAPTASDRPAVESDEFKPRQEYDASKEVLDENMTLQKSLQENNKTTELERNSFKELAWKAGKGACT